jgi:hypothetical protein
MRLTDGLDIPEACPGCSMGKLHRREFKDRVFHATDKLQEVHADLIGKIDTQTRHRNHWALLLVDDFTGHSWLAFHHKKNQAAEKLQLLIASLETQSQKRVQVLRTDGGGEWINQTLDTYLGARGIQRKVNAPYTPQQNGRAERISGVLKEMMLCALHGAGMAEYWWEHALGYANWVRNRLPTKGLGDKDITPHEAWTGRKACLGPAKPFGCMAQYWTPPQGDKGGSAGRKKLDPVARWGVFIGFVEGSTPLHLWDPKKDETLTNRDVVF